MSGVGAAIHQVYEQSLHKHKAKTPKSQVTSAQYLRFQGTLTSGSQAANPQSFTVLAGAGAPSITNGFAQWNVINRPQMVGMTVLAGYNPLTLTVPIRFDCVGDDYLDELGNGRAPNQSAAALERDIEVLEWMAGRGRLFANDGGVGASGVGDSPLVTVSSLDSQNVERPLIPPNAQGLSWVINGLAYDPNPDLNARGYRIRQDATVTLVEFVQDQFSGSADSSSNRAKARTALSGKYTTVYTTSAMNTIQKVANVKANNPGAAREILAANKSNPRIGTSWNKKLPPHTLIRVPASVLRAPATNNVF